MLAQNLLQTVVEQVGSCMVGSTSLAALDIYASHEISVYILWQLLYDVDALVVLALGVDNLDSLILADESTLVAHLSTPLTTYAQGWKDPEDYDSLLEFLFPAVQTGRRFDFYKFDDSADFGVDEDDERPAGANFKVIKYSGSVQPSSTVNRGLSVFVDSDQVAGMPDWRNVYTGRLLRRIKRNAVKRGLDTLLGSATNSGKTWSSSTDPDADVMQLVSDAGDLIGFNPNRLAYVGNAWLKRNLSLRAQDTEGARVSLGLTSPQDVAVYCGAREGRDISARINQTTGGKGKTGGGNYVSPFYADSGAGPEAPRATARFWSTCDNGAPYAVYIRQIGVKFWEITVECYERLVVTSTLGLKKITVS